ncbi:uncharacterized protein LOC116413634 [Galleria mellonella]|uniref:Uncharacterized protein LOC116413634 n=1 Tax=Galleria mellonella TaxID=7137 RepID=A0A6J3CD61_GALME|nr:uncharacterized protein LOC116413634 [Galleria mellonella]
MDSKDEIKLITLVQQYPCLYDIFDPSYNDSQQKYNAWEEIGKLAENRPRECKVKWTRLRENFRKALKMREANKKGGLIRPLKYENHLSFLKPFIKIHAAPPAAQSDESSCMSDEDSSIISNQNENGIFESRKKHKSFSQKVRENDPIDSFFSALATTVKTFPKDLQIHVKRQVFDAVNAAELSLLPSASKYNETKHVAICYNDENTSVMPEIKTEIHEDT